jgi:bifunctional non-homologous end joining protein LigD
MRPSIHSLKPMLSTLAPLPSGEKWSFEPKWDGFRGMCFVTDGSVRLISRLGNDLTRLCPGVLIQANSHIGPAVLDGEIVAFRDGQQSFEALQGVLRRQGAVDDVAFLVFDLLWLRGKSLLAVPYVRRRAQLESLVFEPPLSVSPRFEDGEALFDETLRQGYEGVVAKRRRSMYRPGIRTRDWIKTKHWKVEEFLIGGWAPPRPRHGWGLLVGEPDDTGAVRYLGRVEFGVTEDLIAGLQERLRPLVRRSSAFVEQIREPDATHVEAYLPVEIRYLERTSHGLLRQAAFRQLGGRWKR